ncbi:MAG TPA: YjjG family noncanonical pyrimidine nucleotidase [Paludibacter sp.]|nr:YjjG family noncanonical pyrimidine nucleotidase [Paludibacter sp.]
MYKFVFIDLDDTIWDFHANAKSTLHEIYEIRRLNRYFDSFEQYFGIYAKRNLELWDLYGRGEITKDSLTLERFMHPLLHVGINDPELALNIGREYLEMLPSRTELVPFAKELLDYLYPKYPLTIVSNGFIEVQYKKLRSANLEHYFSHVVLSEEAKALKPDRRIFEHALNLNNAKANETIMIGDSYEADIIGAQNAGIDQVYFNHNLNMTDNNLQCTFKINRLEELLPIL